MISITGTYHFCAAHFLPAVPPGHRCRNMHGHNYKLEITIGLRRKDATFPDDPSGFIIDFYDLDKLIAPLLAQVDHNGPLNDIDGLYNPTAELIAGWFMERLDAGLAAFQFDKPPSDRVIVHSVRVYETPECYATVSRM